MIQFLSPSDCSTVQKYRFKEILSVSKAIFASFQKNLQRFHFRIRIEIRLDTYGSGLLLSPYFLISFFTLLFFSCCLANPSALCCNMSYLFCQSLVDIQLPGPLLYHFHVIPCALLVHVVAFSIYVSRYYILKPTPHTRQPLYPPLTSSP
jgi:hypothetical protein